MSLKNFDPRQDGDDLDELWIRLRLVSEDGRIPCSFLTNSVTSIEQDSE